MFKLKLYFNLHKIPILLVLGSIAFYAVFAHDLARADFPKLISLYAALFFLHFKLIQFEKWNFKFLLVAGLLFRLVFLMAEPNLSQDFYRFIWDGELINQGINPYILTPQEIIDDPNFHVPNSGVLFEGMGGLSARHYSNYPPVNQLLFAVCTFLGMGSIMSSMAWMRVLLILADVGILFFGQKLLQRLNLSSHLIFWYFINPLVIVELTGNLHFEGVMLFFFIWALYLISIGKPLFSAPIYAASIMLKLVPVLFLPLFLNYLGFKKSVLFYLFVGLACLAFLLPFHSPSLIENYSQTVGLWFSNFEFNAGIYNLVKKVALIRYDAKPWELIKDYGLLLKLYTPLVILWIALFRGNQNLRSVIESMLLVICFYYFLSTTVHPWYIIFPLLLGLFTEYRFVIVWSATAMLSYFTYSQLDFKENLWLVSLEYLLVFGYLGYEILKKHNISGLIRKKS